MNLTLCPQLSEGSGTGAQYVDPSLKVVSVVLDIHWMVLFTNIKAKASHGNGKVS